MQNPLKTKIERKQAKIGIVGLGYVGLPLAVDLAKAGFDVTGFDVSEQRVKSINAGKSYVEDIPSAELKEVSGKLKATSDFRFLKDIDAVSICVPTPLGKTHDPDVSFIVNVRDRLKQQIHPNMLVILESTTYPGTTEELFEPMVKEARLKLGVDFFLAFSPVRGRGRSVHTGPCNAGQTQGGEA